MSRDTVEQFFGHMTDDESLREEYEKAIADAIESAVGPAIVRLAAAHGYQFDAGAVREHFEAVSNELNDDDLDGVVGGFTGKRPSFRSLQNPWLVGAIVTTAIAIPLAIHGDDDDAS